MLDINKEIKQPVYLREIEIRYKKKRIANDALNASLTSPSEVIKLFHGLQDETKEKMITINLDSKYKIICFEIVAIGSIHSIYIRPMEVFRTAFPVNAYGAIVLHNHPSGDPTPSKKDIDFTKKLNRLASDMGLDFVDHIIIGDGRYYSFKESSSII